MDMNKFCRALPKIELHAHLNGSLSRSTMLELQRYYADSGIRDKTNAFFDEFEIGAGDSRNLHECFQVFKIAHALTITPQALSIATLLTLQEFQDDGCCYIELRSTPRDTEYMTKKQYIETIVEAIRNSSQKMTIISRLIISINRNSTSDEVENIVNLAVEGYKKYPDVIVGIELSGDPTVKEFKDFKSPLLRARQAGLKITLHCGEICNPSEVLEMLKFKPERIGHGVCIHPRLGGTEETWFVLCESNIPVELCLTSNINTKSISDYDSHHFKEYYEANIPIIICTDDKGVFATSLSQEYHLCADTFNLNKSQLAKLALGACQYIFAEDVRDTVTNKLLDFINKESL